jgi:hypothetical protein
MPTNFLYTYAILLAASILGYREVQPMILLVVIALLTLPVIIRERNDHTLALTAALGAAHAALFTMVAYAIGRGVFWLLHS